MTTYEKFLHYAKTLANQNGSNDAEDDNEYGDKKYIVNGSDEYFMGNKEQVILSIIDRLRLNEHTFDESVFNGSNFDARNRIWDFLETYYGLEEYEEVVPSALNEKNYMQELYHEFIKYLEDDSKEEDDKNKQKVTIFLSFHGPAVDEEQKKNKREIPISYTFYGTLSQCLLKIRDAKLYNFQVLVYLLESYPDLTNKELCERLTANANDNFFYIYENSKLRLFTLRVVKDVTHADLSSKR